MSTSLLQVRIDDDLKAKATQIYSELGLDISSAVRMFLKRSVLENGIPFSMVLPVNNRHTDGLNALTEINHVAKQSDVSDMSFKEINAEVNMTRQER